MKLPEVPPLADDQVHLWRAQYRHGFSACQLQSYLHLLSDQEKQTFLQRLYKNDQQLYLVTRAMVRTVLSSYCGIDAKLLEFKFSDHGKPVLANHPMLSFNLSHAGNRVVLAVSKQRELGVDIELAQQQINLHQIARFFSPSERQWLKEQPAEQQSCSFFQLWTLKEAYLKAIGEGISGLKACASFDLTIKGKIKCEQLSSIWSYSQFSLDDDYLVALCVQQQGDISHPSVSLFDWQLKQQQQLPLFRVS